MDCKLTIERPLFLFIVIISAFFYGMTFYGPFNEMSYLDVQTFILNQDLNQLTFSGFVVVTVYLKCGILMVAMMCFALFRCMVPCMMKPMTAMMEMMKGKAVGPNTEV